jgi:hypothetical protein
MNAFKEPYYLCEIERFVGIVCKEYRLSCQTAWVQILSAPVTDLCDLVVQVSSFLSDSCFWLGFFIFATSKMEKITVLTSEWYYYRN